MFFIYFFSRFINRFALCVLFRLAMSAHQFMVTSTCMYTNVTVVINVLVVVYNKTWENQVYAISSWSASAGFSASMLIRVAKVDLSLTHQFSTLSQHLCRYPALPDHDSMNNPSLSQCLSIWCVFSECTWGDHWYRVGDGLAGGSSKTKTRRPLYSVWRR